MVPGTEPSLLASRRLRSLCLALGRWHCQEGALGREMRLGVLRGCPELGWRTQWCFRQEVTWQLGQML